MMKVIRWQAEQHRLVVGGERSFRRGDFIPFEAAVDLSLSSFRRALADMASVSIPPLKELRRVVGLSNVGHDYSPVLAEATIINDGDPPRFVGLHLVPDGYLIASVGIYEPAYIEEDDVLRVLVPLLSRVGMSVRAIKYVNRVDFDDSRSLWELEFDLNIERRCVGDVYRIFQSVETLLTTTVQGVLRSLEGAELFVRSGSPDALVGFEECSWLEVKSQGYNLSDDCEKIKLAQDVVRFANGESGGMIVLGARAPRGSAVIEAITPLQLEPNAVARYRVVIDKHVFPLVEGLRVYDVPFRDGGLLIIYVPPQSTYNKPFVCYGNLGSISQGRVKGSFVSIVERRGDGAEHLSGPAIQSLLTAGRMLFRSRESPGQS